MKNKRLYLWIFVILISVVFTACSVKNNETTVEVPTEIVEPTTEVIEKPIVPTFGGTLKLTSRNPITLNPLLNEDRSVDQVLKLVFEPLFKIDENYQPMPNLVETFSYDAANQFITLTLKKDLVFHDQSP